MRCRPIDENGDMMPVFSEKDMLEGYKAVGTIAGERLKLIRGEWWEDETVGFRMVPYLIDSAKENETNFFMNYITSYLAATEGCKGITDVEVTYKNRELKYSCRMIADGGSMNLEVGEDELLSTVY